MAEMRVLIAAAGTGSRAGLSYPKTLHPVLGKPILLRLVDVMRPYDPTPVVIVSPGGRTPIEQCLADHGYHAEIVEQAEATGMGDAILRFQASSSWGTTKHLFTVWGDIPLLQPETVAALHAAHFASENDFSFVTKVVEEAYTVVERDSANRVRSLRETRELNLPSGPGERDIGLFLFRIEPVFDLLERHLPGAIGETTGEHGFLYIVDHLVERGFRVEALPIATENDLISLNRLSDVDLSSEHGL